MISVILYGRNDAHGYNLHRRAALSLNCIAEVLTDADDELIFVDYNTPDELPTFIEAISDTLTEQCLNRLRVLRVPAAIHDQRFAQRTHLPALEPIARNVAARRANPGNRWLLSTNTDMIFVPAKGESLSEICRDLVDGFYALPRFELPEWLWEWLPRTDPQRAVAEIGRLGPRIRLDEATVSHEWIRFDAPGDFQLMLRDDFLAVDGFDEEMLLGYHVDSNMSRRLLLHRGSIETLEEELSGYHCNHNRTLTVYHGSVPSNDLDKFFHDVDEAPLPAQRSTWGLSDVTVEEVPIRHGVGARSAAVLSELVPVGARSSSDAFGNPYSLTYDSGHVAAYVVDTLVVSPLKARIGYVGVNPILERILAEAIDRLGFEHPLAAARFDDTRAVDEIAQGVDVFIIDLGLDGADAGDDVISAGTETDLSKLPASLVDAVGALSHVISVERTRYERVKHPRTMMLVNSSAAYCDAYVRAQFDCSYSTIHSRVRRATVKPAEQADMIEIDRWLTWFYKMLRWSRRDQDKGRMAVRPGESVDVKKLKEYAGFGPGWSHPDDSGIWTEGPRSKLTIGVEGIGDGDHVLTLMIDMICVAGDDLLGVTLLAGDEQVATREFASASAAFPWRVELPASVRSAGEIELTFIVDEPHSPLELGWSIDDRLLGIHIQTLTVEPVDRLLTMGEDVVFAKGSGAERLLGDGWWPPEPTGVWTAGEVARLNLQLPETAPTPLELVLDGIPFLTGKHRKLDVEVWADNERVGARRFRYRLPSRPLRVRLSDASMDSERHARLDLRLRDPVRPVDLGVSGDHRLLGLRLRSLAIEDRGTTGDGDRLGLNKLRNVLAVNGRHDGPSASTCIACGKPLSTAHWMGAARLAACASCGSRTAVPRPSLGDTTELHDSAEYFEKEYFDARRNREVVTERRARRILELVRTKQPEARLAGTRVLDIGCDTGEFASAFARLCGAQAYGVDVAERPLRRARELGLEVSHGDLSEAPESFDNFALVTAIDVIEHVPDPGAFLEEIRRRLAPGGLVYLETPNWRSAVYAAGSLAARALGSRPGWVFDRLFPPEHVQYFTPEGLSTLVSRAGFRPVASFAQPLRREALAAGPRVAAAVEALQIVDRLTGREILLSALLEVTEGVR